MQKATAVEELDLEKEQQKPKKGNEGSLSALSALCSKNAQGMRRSGGMREEEKEEK